MNLWNTKKWEKEASRYAFKSVNVLCCPQSVYMQTNWGQLFLFARYWMFTFVPNYKYYKINLYLKSMKTMKYLSMLLMMVALSVCMVSCGDDDDPIGDSFQDYYIEADVQGGGLDAAEINELKSELNADLSDVRWEKMTKEDAVYYFDRSVKNLKQSFAEGMSGINGTLRITLTLKTSNGVVVKKSTLNITKDGCTVN